MTPRLDLQDAAEEAERPPATDDNAGVGAVVVECRRQGDDNDAAAAGPEDVELTLSPE